MLKALVIFLCICYCISLAFQYLDDDSDHWTEPLIKALVQPVEAIGLHVFLCVLLGITMIALLVPFEFL